MLRRKRRTKWGVFFTANFFPFPGFGELGRRLMEGVEGMASGSFVTMNLGVEEDEVTPDLSGQVHHLPCCIKFDGPSQVSHYFKPKPTGNSFLFPIYHSSLHSFTYNLLFASGIENDGLVVQKSYFRGRELLGATVPLSHHYSGSLLPLLYHILLY